MDRIQQYLCIPPNYDPWLDRLHWAPKGDAVEREDGSTFALAVEIGLFLEGFAASHRLIHFAYMLHLLQLLGHGHIVVSQAATVPLVNAYLEARRPVRNAGVLCGLLCRSIPPVAEPVDAMAMRGLLAHPMRSVYWVDWKEQEVLYSSATESTIELPSIEVPPLEARVFEARFLEALQGFTYEQLQHWFRHGCAPEPQAGEQIAREVAAVKPRSLMGALAILAQRQRFTGAAPFVAQLVSALTLPPRRLAQRQLPMGGYADVAMRGQPEQILPSQFAVDDLEFLRRFAENELLYFRREEPHARTQEELVILLDQGVRTWGRVRLLLSAAVLALGKLAIRRRLPLRMAATSTRGQLVDPLQVEDAALGELLEASDLTANPGLALERVLEEPTTDARDIVLLTQPRSLRDEEVATAARRVLPGTRLFAVAAEESGAVQFVEMKHGTPVPLYRFHVDLDSRAAVQPSASVPPAPGTGWQGDVELVGFPFRFGVTGNLLERGFDFDQAGEWLLTASARGTLHAWRVDGSQAEVLPRGMVNGEVVTQVEAVLGVAGGFVVCGRVQKQLAAIHYDFTRRTVHAYLLGQATEDKWKWYYFPALNSVVVRDRALAYAVDLDTGGRYPSPGGRLDLVVRAQKACAESHEFTVPPPWMYLYSTMPTVQARGLWVYLDRDAGQLLLRGTDRVWAFTPQSDGLPMLEGHLILDAQCRGNVLAATCFRPGEYERITLRLFRGPEGTPLQEFPHGHGRWGFMLSSDGRRLARQISHRQVEVRDLTGGSIWVTTEGKCHQDLSVELGIMWLSVQVGNWTHLFRWNGPELVIRGSRGNYQKFLRSELGGLSLEGTRKADRLPSPRPCLGHDPQRFLAITEIEPMIVLVDAYSQIAVFDSSELIVMFFVFRDQVAAWMPDGTRFGPAAITGGPATPDALHKIGQALRHAQRQESQP